MTPHKVAQNVPGSAKADVPSNEPSSESASESSEGSSDEYESDEDEPFPLPETRPTESLKALEFDTVKIMWSPNRVLSAKEIKAALADFWKTVKQLNEARAAASKELQLEETKDASILKKIRAEVIELRKRLEVVIAASLKFGHDDVLGRYV